MWDQFDNSNKLYLTLQNVGDLHSQEFGEIYTSWSVKVSPKLFFKIILTRPNFLTEGISWLWENKE